MGLIVPWAKYQCEWKEIQQYRQKGQILTHRPEPNYLLAPQIVPKFPWLPRNVSLMLGFTTKSCYHDQTQSLLFKLPKELRLAIWGYVIGHHEITIVRKINKLAHAILPRDAERLKRAAVVSANKSWLQPLGYEMRYKPHVITSKTSLLTPLLFTCKRVYAEAAEVLYGESLFEFTTIESLYKFLLTASPLGLQCIRSMKIRWGGFAFWETFQTDEEGEPLYEHDVIWQEICENIGRLGSLRSLTLAAVRREYSWNDMKGDEFCQVGAIALPLASLPESVDFHYAYPVNKAKEKKSHRVKKTEEPISLELLRQQGCKNLKLTKLTSLDEEKHSDTNYHNDW